MEKNQAEGKLDQLNARLKRQWGELTDDEVAKAEGNRDELIAKIQEKYGEGREAIAKKLNEIFD
ncbi:MAG TPA: CsbD family protein [Wenzhouxiangella sp.]|nr:CsbD family protein [Wenzhouxiangella sp.]